MSSSSLVIRKTGSRITKLCALLQQYSCRKCGSEHMLTLDHIVPLAKHGLDGVANYQILCYQCNQEKGCMLECEPVDIVMAGDIKSLFSRSVGSTYGTYYSESVFDACFKIKTHGVITHADLLRLYEYANGFGLPGLKFKGKLNSLKFKKVPSDSKHIIRYDPDFKLSNKAIESYSRSLFRQAIESFNVELKMCN